MTATAESVCACGHSAMDHHRVTGDAYGCTERGCACRSFTPAAPPAGAPGTGEVRIHGVTWLLLRDGAVLLERCPKKARVLGVGEWFVPGGKVEGDETPEQAVRREIGEEWPGVEVETMTPLPIVEGSAVPPGPRGLFLMRPFVVTVRGEVPTESGDGPPLRWAPITEALLSPVPQVRMMVAAAAATSLRPQLAAREAELQAARGDRDDAARWRVLVDNEWHLVHVGGGEDREWRVCVGVNPTRPLENVNHYAATAEGAIDAARAAGRGAER